MIYFIKNIKETLQYNTFRSLLTGLGVFIGVVSIIIIVTLTDSFSNDIRSSLSTETIIGLAISANSSKTEEDVMSDINVIQSIDAVKAFIEIKEFSTSQTEKLVNIYTPQKIYEENINVEFKNVEVFEGKTFDEATGNTVIARFNEDFNLPYSIGDILFINNESFELIGLTEDVGNSYPALYFPEYLEPEMYVMETSTLGMFQLIVNDGYEFDTVKTKVLNELNSSLSDDIKFTDYTEEANTLMEDSMQTISIFLALIAGVSLVVAAINVLNIMYISALEKRNEIAIYRALGMSRKNVLLLFLAESFVLVATFAIIGYVFGVFISAVILTLVNIHMVFSLWNFMLVILFAILIGVGGGLKPALNAAKINPAELLR